MRRDEAENSRRRRDSAKGRGQSETLKANVGCEPDSCHSITAYSRRRGFIPLVTLPYFLIGYLLRQALVARVDVARGKSTTTWYEYDKVSHTFD